MGWKEYLVQVHGEKEGGSMNKKTIKYTNAPTDISEAINNSVIIKDFLPSPDELVLKEKTQRITINLSEKSINFFKTTAKKNKVSYQQMIKEILDRYTDYYNYKHN